MLFLEETMQNMRYCPLNVSFDNFWVDHGMSQCFQDTIISGFISGFIFLFGSIQLIMFKRYAVDLSRDHIQKSKLYMLQIFLLILAPTLTIIRFVLRGVVYNDGGIYGFMVKALNFVNFKTDQINFTFLDFITNSYTNSIHICNNTCYKRAIFYFAISTNIWPWVGSFNILRYGIHSAKCQPGQFESRRLVVSR